MSGKTKIVVLHMKEVVYTVLFVLFAVVMAVLLFFMFGTDKKEGNGSSASSSSSSSVVSGPAAVYRPGIYTSSIELGDSTFDIEVTVSEQEIQSVALSNISETVTAKFPLIEPSLEELAAQIYASQSLENLSFSEESRYTSLLLLRGIDGALKKAKVEDES